MNILMKDLTVKYQHKKEVHTALNHINLEVRSGEFLMVLGESGSGKTTLIHCLAGLHTLYEGSIHYNNQDISLIPVNELNVGYISQEYRLYPTLTVFDNIAFPLLVEKVPADEIRKRVKEIARLLEIDFLLTRKPKVLSGGQQQRVAIARAMIKKPSIFLLDEPLSNLDENTRDEFRHLFRKLHSQMKTTFIYVTHSSKEALTLGSSVAILYEGQLIQRGTPNEVYTNPTNDYVRSLLHDVEIDFKDDQNDTTI